MFHAVSSLPSEALKRDDSKVLMSLIDSMRTVGLPKGGNSYGNRVSIVPEVRFAGSGTGNRLYCSGSSSLEVKDPVGRIS
jgi:hypothetical protein